MNFNLTNYKFEAKFNVNSRIREPSVLFLSREYTYINGFGLWILDKWGKEIEDKHWVLHKVTDNTLNITFNGPIYNGRNVTLVVVDNTGMEEPIVETSTRKVFFS